MIHEFDPRRAPDSEYEPGELEWLVAGNRGRMLDPRRTPITILSIDPDTAHFGLRVEAFEDQGAIWHLPLESVTRFQFARGSARAVAADLERFDQPLAIACDAARGQETREAIAARAAQAEHWIRERNGLGRAGREIDFSSLTGSASLASDLLAYMREHDLDDVEKDFSRGWASNPRSGEMVKGHRIVLAELGLVPYVGSVVRAPSLFGGRWSRERRALHVQARLGFVRALFRLLGRETVVLYRGLCCNGPPEAPPNETFVSASFSFDVARSCTGEIDAAGIGVLLRQPVSVERLFMTYLETAALNDPFREAEAVLLWEPGNRIF